MDVGWGVIGLELYCVCPRIGSEPYHLFGEGITSLMIVPDLRDDEYPLVRVK
jgi:hypothetical protein